MFRPLDTRTDFHRNMQPYQGQEFRIPFLYGYIVALYFCLLLVRYLCGHDSILIATPHIYANILLLLLLTCIVTNTIVSRFYTHGYLVLPGVEVINLGLLTPATLLVAMYFP